MKPGDLKNPLKYRNRFNQTELYYSFPHWSLKIVDGVEFLAVVRNVPSNMTQTIHYIRKDSLEKIK